MKYTITSLFAIICLVGCAHNSTTVLATTKINGPKTIALDAPREPWVIQVETRLRDLGFKVTRRSANRRITETAGPGRSETSDGNGARYLLVLSGQAPLDAMHRCFGGGFKFDFVTAEVIDQETDATLVNVNGAGYSEGCQPMSGTLFMDIATAVNKLW